MKNGMVVKICMKDLATNHQHNTASGYITYDVPDSDHYTLELDTIPNFKKVRAQWIINKSEIKNSNVTKDTLTSSTTDVEDESDTTSSSKNDDSNQGRGRDIPLLICIML